MSDQTQSQQDSDNIQTQNDGDDQQQQNYDYSAYYQYYQQNPELYMQYMQQWQQYQQQMASSSGGSSTTSSTTTSSSTTQPYDYSAYYQMYNQQTDGSTSSYLNMTGTGGTSQQPSNTLWVGSLPWECTEQDLRIAFQEFGQIDNIRMLPAKNCAFVTFTHIECALTAFEHSYGILVKGSTVKIGWGKATPINMIQRNPYEGMPPSRNIFIGSIDVTTSEDELRNFFIQFGPIERVKILPHKQCAFILFTHLESATKAKETMNGQIFKGVTIKVNYGKQPEALVNPNAPTTTTTHQTTSSSSVDQFSSESKPSPPEDPEIQNIIDKLVFFVSRSQNSDHLEEFVRKRQENNPKFSFLNGGEGHDYYKWKLKIEKAMIPKSSKDELPPWLQNVNETKEYDVPESPFPHIENPLSRDEKQELNDLLNNLVGSKESIKYGRDWIFNHLKNALVIGKLIHDYVVSKTSDFSKQLSCLHLIFDVLHHSYNNLRKEGSKMDEISYSVKNYIPLMMKKTFQNASDEEQRMKVLKLFSKWQEKDVFDQETMDNIENALNSK